MYPGAVAPNFDRIEGEKSTPLAKEGTALEEILKETRETSEIAAL